jgi:hypothetical protein
VCPSRPFPPRIPSPPIHPRFLPFLNRSVFEC